MCWRSKRGKRMSDKKEKTKNEDKEVKPDMILINTVYTGDYTNENIGHEIINMYKTEKDENYIYISPWGTIAKDNYNKIKEVIFVRDAGKNKLEIIGRAEGKTNDKKNKEPLNYWGNEGIDKKYKYQIAKIKRDIEKILGDKNIKYNKKFEYIGNNNKKATYKDMEDFIDFAFKKIKEKIKNDIQEDSEKKLQRKLNLRFSKDDFQKLIKDSANNDVKKTELDLRCNYKNRIEKEYKHLKSKYIHDLQLVYIKKKKIKYNGKFINEVFEDNFHKIPPIYLTFKADCVKKAKKSFIIDYDDKNIKEILKKAKFENKENDEQKNIKLRNQSCLYYLSQENYKKIINISETNKDINNDEYNNPINWEDTKKLKRNTDKKDEETFIDIIRKPYDELVFSNMIAYYFENDKELFQKFCKYLKSNKGSDKKSDETIINNVAIKKLDKLTINETYEISREYKVDKGRIDILIRTDDSLFIIENKIKSDINGKQYDPYTGEYSDQLINYYKYFNPDEKNEFDEDFKNIKHQYYFIFTPNYNKIDKEKIKKIINPSKEKNNESCNIIDLYSIITYKDLYNFFSKEKNKPKQVTSVKQKIYFEDFISSLEQHSHSCDDVIERRMENEFRQKTKK